VAPENLFRQRRSPEDDDATAKSVVVDQFRHHHSYEVSDENNLRRTEENEEQEDTQPTKSDHDDDDDDDYVKRGGQCCSLVSCKLPSLELTHMLDQSDEDGPMATHISPHPWRTEEKKKKVVRLKPSVYNVFMKREMAAIKEADPDLPHKDIFKLAASRVTHR